jgi:prepilin-type N-terminal cleavage/methylation domain-containing protein
MLQRGHRMTTARGEDGFTLIELLVTMVIALIVFAATLSALTVFSRDSQAMTKRNNAQNQARLAIDQIVRQLRNIASPGASSQKLLERAAPYDIVFQTVGSQWGGNAQGIQRVRYCIPPDTNPGSASTEVMIAQVQTWNTPAIPRDPWSSDPTATIPCPDTSVTSTSSVQFTTTVLANYVTNQFQGRTDRPAFSYSGTAANGTAYNDLTQVPAANLGTIDTVGLDLFVNPTTPLNDAETELRSAAFLRNEQRAPVASFTYTVLGGGAVLLNGGTSYSPSGDPLSYSWSCAPVACSSTGAIFDWKPGPNTYTVTLTVTDPTGLKTTSAPQTVTVT